MITVIGHRYWRDRFAGSPTVVGQVLRENVFLDRMISILSAAFALLATLLAAVAFGAGWLPARRASRTEPMRALRYG